MNRELYTKVFGNKFLSNKVFDYVYQIQSGRYSLRYQDIVDIGWMTMYGHVALAKEKVQNSHRQQLFVNPRDLFSVVANADTELFIRVFELFKYSALEYYYLSGTAVFDADSEVHTVPLRNLEVIQYLYDNGYIIPLDELEISMVDIKVLSHLVKIGWLRFTSLDSIRGVIEPSEAGKECSKEVVDLVFQHYTTPISVKDAKEIIESNIESPVESVFEYLVPLFDKGIKKQKIGKRSYQEAIALIQAKIKEKSAIKAAILNKIPFDIDVPSAFIGNVYAQWWPWVEQGEQTFFDLWGAYSFTHIRVTSTSIYYHTRGIPSQGPAGNDQFVVEIGEYLTKLCCINASLRVMECLHNRGYTQLAINYELGTEAFESFYMQLAKKTSKEDRALVVKLSGAEYNYMISRVQILYACMDQMANFEYYFGEFIDGLKREPNAVTRLLSKAIYHPSIFKMIQSHGYQLSDNYDEAIDVFIFHTMKNVLDDVDRVFEKTPVEKKDTLCLRLLVVAISRNEYSAVKYLLNKLIVSPPLSQDQSSFYTSLASSRNLSIIDMINNSDLCFARESKRSFFLEILNPSSYPQRDQVEEEIDEYEQDDQDKDEQGDENENEDEDEDENEDEEENEDEDEDEEDEDEDCGEFNIPLIDYMIKHKCIDINALSPAQLDSISPFFCPNKEMKEVIKYIHQLAFLVDTRNYDSIEPFINTLTSDELGNSCGDPNRDKCELNLQMIDYIDRNQSKFKNQIEWQLVFDTIVKEKENLLNYKSLLGALVNRYQCTLHDDHYRHLVQNKDGLTLFGQVPNSIPSKKYKPPKIMKQTPLKKQKK